MFPSQTSLIPVTVALVRFLETHGVSSFDTTYPYWYMWTTPFRFLMGPVVPIVEVFFHKLLPNVSLFDITILFVGVSFLLSALGWGALSLRICGIRKVGVMVGILLLVLPWRYFSAVAFDEGSAVIARNFLPFALLGIWNLFEQKNVRNWLLAVILVSVLFLMNTEVSPSLFVGIVALILAGSYRDGKIRPSLVSKYAKIFLLVISSSLLVSTVWYTPGYWITVLGNPSVGGASGVKAAINVINFLKTVLPIFLAVGAVYFWIKIKDRFRVFWLTWTLSFGLLTAFRFLANPNFWMDWTAWLGEIEVGIALLVASKLQTNWHPMVGALLLPFITTYLLWLRFSKPALIASSPPEALQSLTKLNEVAGSSRVFVSGASVFWLNAFYDIPQVRGGRDEVSVDPNWRKAAWEFREGERSDEAIRWIKRLDIRYVLVHTSSSSEFYHDFKNIEKWDEIGKKIWEGEGDIIYQIRD